MKTNVSCMYHEDRIALNTILIEGGHLVEVCNECRDKILRDGHVRIVCKFCGAAVRSEQDPYPAHSEHRHQYGCPRR